MADEDMNPDVPQGLEDDIPAQAEEQEDDGKANGGELVDEEAGEEDEDEGEDEEPSLVDSSEEEDDEEGNEYEVRPQRILDSMADMSVRPGRQWYTDGAGITVAAPGSVPAFAPSPLQRARTAPRPLPPSTLA